MTAGVPMRYPNGKQPHYVYRCYDADSRLIYVGCTINPNGRMAQHRSVTWWALQVAQVRNTVFPNREYALGQERLAIAEENPRWNIKSRWPYRSLWTADDYADYYLAVLRAPGGATTPPTIRHLERVAVEARRRYGINLEETAA